MSVALQIRTDNAPSEFFLQLKGSMKVVTIQENKQKPVPIEAGYAYLLPSRVRHSPRREANSVGLVIEREREPGELDSMCWFVDDVSGQVLWEKYFVCNDLGKDLVPIVHEFQASEESKTGRPKSKPLGLHVPLAPTVPAPIRFDDRVQQVLREKKDLKVFHDSHPDKEFDIVLETEGRKRWTNRKEIFLYQIKGSAKLPSNGITLNEGECAVALLDSDHPELVIERETGSVGLVVCVRDVRGNKVQSKL